MFVTLMTVGAARVRQRRRPAYDKSDELVAPRRRIDYLELPLGDKGPVGSAASAEESGSGALRMMTTGGISAEHVVDGMHSALKSLTHCVSFSPYDKSQRSSFAVWKQASLPEATHAKYMAALASLDWERPVMPCEDAFHGPSRQSGSLGHRNLGELPSRCMSWITEVAELTAGH